MFGHSGYIYLVLPGRVVLPTLDGERARVGGSDQHEYLAEFLLRFLLRLEHFVEQIARQR